MERDVIEVYCDACKTTTKGTLHADATWEERVGAVNAMRERHREVCENRPPDWDVEVTGDEDRVQFDVWDQEIEGYISSYSLTWDQVEALVGELSLLLDERRLRRT